MNYLLTPVGWHNILKPFSEFTGKGFLIYKLIYEENCNSPRYGVCFSQTKHALGNRQPTAIEIRQFALKCVEKDEEVFRIYCYDCPPYAEKQTHPLSKKTIDFAATPTFSSRTKVISDLKIMDNIAFRAGELSFDGWIISKKVTKWSVN